MEIFIFNLNKKTKYKKLNEGFSIYCANNFGPYTVFFGYHSTYSMKSINVWCSILINIMKIVQEFFQIMVNL